MTTDAPDASIGPRAVALARRALVASVVEGAGRDPSRTVLAGAALPEAFRSPRGVFVTLETYPTGRLRGCIGFPLPVYPLGTAIVRAAAAAALEDPRFPPVRAAELDGLTVEVSVLTVPEPIEGPPERRPEHVRVGTDGLIVEEGGEYGLLLPQVAPDQGWDAREFLAGTCEKAGIAPGAWRRPSVTVRRFQANIYHETRPNGPVEAAASDRSPG